MRASSQIGGAGLGVADVVAGVLDEDVVERGPAHVDALDAVAGGEGAELLGEPVDFDGVIAGGRRGDGVGFGSGHRLMVAMP